MDYFHGLSRLAVATISHLALETPATHVEKNSVKLLSDFTLYQNYPNPFNPKTIIPYTVGAIHELPLHIDLSIYNILGKKMCTLVSETQKAGNYQVEWDASGFASGVYLYKLTTDNGYENIKKLVLLK